MNVAAQRSFEQFAGAFVRCYWETVKSGAFPMEPDEPVEETVEELLSEISYSVEFESGSGSTRPLHELRMTNTAHGDWLLFDFQQAACGWTIVGCFAKSLDPEKPHDLLGPVYERSFKPFLRHVSEVANARTGI